MFKKIIGYFIIILSIINIIIKYSTTQNLKEKEEKNIAKYLAKSNDKNEKQNSFIAILEIPKINLKKGLYNINSKENNVDKNIEILHESQMPDINNGNFILASHSGTSKISYFKNLDKLNINDKLIIYYKTEKYTYKLVNIYEVDKTGSIEIIRNHNKRALTLITCNKNNKSKQLVFIAELDTIEQLIANNSN